MRWLFILMPLLAACDAQQSTGNGSRISASLPGRDSTAVRDSVYVVSEASVAFGRPAGTIAVEEMPAGVQDVILEQRKRRLDTLFGMYSSSAAKESLITGAQTIQRMRISDSIDAYLLHVSDIGGEDWAIWLRGASGHLSPSPLRLSGSLAGQPDDTAYGPGSRMPGTSALRIEDVDSDGCPELLLSTRRHNGNVYDAIVTYYLRYDAALRLSEVLRVEGRATLPLDTFGRRIQRTASYDRGSGAFIIKASLMDGGKATPIGSVVMTYGGKPVQRRPIPGTPYARLLLTCHPEGEGYFFSFPPKL